MGTVHQLKVTIVGIKPPIWRRVVVSSSISLGELHTVLQAAFGWWDCHLHEFEIGTRRYEPPDDVDRDPSSWDENRARLDRVAPAGATFAYTYDFGDDWRHKIRVESVTPADPAQPHPACVGGRRACPPEDCGGVRGYELLLTILSDSNHEDHASMLEWLGRPFDPEAFDASEFDDNLTLGRLAAP